VAASNRGHSDSDMEISARDLTFGYSEGPGAFKLECRGLRLVGGTVALLHGANGAGKSTFMGVLSGQLRPSTGVVSVADGDARLRLRHEVIWLDGRRGVGLADPLRVSDHVLLALSLSGRRVPLFARSPQARRCVESALIATGMSVLNPYIDHEVRLLSSGYRQLLGLAMILGSGRRLILADELFSNIDQNNLDVVRLKLADYITRINGVMVFASHMDVGIQNCVIEVADGRVYME
jgi:ABC-type Mn2+/Zn2+ transport system ATPase subunit